MKANSVNIWRARIPAGLVPTIWVISTIGGVLTVAWVTVFFSTRHFTDGSEFLPFYRAPQHIESIVYYRMDYALHSNESNRVIFLGSSAAATGVITRSFEKATGLSAYNLGTMRPLGPDGDLELLNFYLQNHPKPEMLVYFAFPPDLVHRSASYSEFRHRFMRAYSTGLLYEDAPPSLTPAHYLQEGVQAIYGLIRGGANHYFYVEKDSGRINKEVGFRGNPYTHAGIGKMVAWERGYFELPPLDSNRLEFQFLDGDFQGPISEFTMTEWWSKSFENLAELADEHDIELVIWMMPIPEPESPISDQPLKSWAKEFKAAFPDVFIVGLPVASYRHELFRDISHMNRSGATIFTSEVSQTLLQFIQSRS